MKTRTTKLFAARFVMTLLAVLTTTTMAAWQRTPPNYCIDFVKGGLGEVCVQGWAYDPLADDQELEIVVVASTQPNDSYEGYEPVRTDDGYDCEPYLVRYSVESMNATYNVSGNHGFTVRLPLYESAHLFGVENELLMYVKIYARTYEYKNTSEYNPHRKDYEFLLYETKDPVKVVRNIGDGTDNNPFVIFNAKHWDAVANAYNDANLNTFYADKFFQLNDEDGDEFDYKDSTPVTKMFGTSTSPFAGTFDGKGKTVNVNLSGTMHVAPFAYADGATIKNLNIAGNISASWSAGGIVGDGGSSTLNLQNCVCSANISGFSNFAGGLMGWTEEDMTLNIKDCLFSGSFAPGDGGKYHPIACKKATKTVSGNIVRAFYLNTVSPSAGLGSNIIVRANGFPLSKMLVNGEWDEPITAADGQTYYATHFTGKRLDYSYGFGVDNYDNDAVIDEGWTLLDFEGNPWENRMSFPSEKDHPQYLISPEFDGYDAMTLSFEYSRGVYVGKSYTFQVGYSTTTKDLEAFTWNDEIVHTAELGDVYGHLSYKQDYPGGVKYIAIKYHCSTQYLYVTNFIFKACHFPSPTDLTLSKVADQKVTFTWNAPDVVLPITGYSYQYKKASDESWPAENLTTTSLSAELTGLTPQTSYNFRVCTNYSNGESDWQTFDFSSAPTMPYAYGFENVTDGHSVADGWRMYNCYVDYQDITTIESEKYTGVRTFAKHYGDKGFFFSQYSIPQYLISPCLSNQTPIVLSFYYKDNMPQASSAKLEKFRVGYSTTTNDVRAFMWGEETSVVRGADWTEFKETFPEGTRYIAVAYTIQQFGLYIDDFTFETYSSKPKPVNLAISNLTDQSATFAWEAPDASATGYAYQYKKADEMVWSDEATTTATTVTISSLTANTSYEFRVKALFSGNEASNYEAKSFMSEGPVVTTLPYTESFENGMGSWRVASAHVSSTIISKPANARSGNNCFLFYPESAVNGVRDGQYLISPQFDGKTSMNFSFYYRGYSDDQAYFQVGYSITTKNGIEDFHWSGRYITTGNWQECSIYCPEGTKYVAIRWYHGLWLYLDDFTVDVSITPTSPENLAATDVTATSADLSWTGNAGNYEMRYREKPLFFDDFEGDSELWTNNGSLGYWRTLTLTGVNYVNHILQSTNILYTPDQNGNVIQTDIMPVDTWRISPKVSLTGTFSFLARYYSETFDENTDKCEVLVSTTVNNDINAFTPIGTIGYTTTEDFFNLNYYSCSLDSYNGQEGYIAFRHKSSHKSWLILDDIGIYRTTDEWTTLTTTENNVKLTGLEPQTVHEFQVQSLLYNYSSGWTDITSFTTEGYKLLAGNVDNSTAIGAIADGKKHDVMLQDYTLSRKRDEWNTLCLPFNVVDGNPTDGITFSGTPLEGATVKELTDSDFSNDELTMDFTEVASIEAGKPYIVRWPNGADLVIHNDNEWGEFLSRVAAGETFAGKYVILDSDINVSRMVGTEEHPFCGTFDGNGHTLNVSIDNAAADYAAPFQYINDATVCNLKVTGSVSGGQYCAGIAGKAIGGTNSIRDCWIAATVTNPDHVGGVLGHGSSSSVTISGCYLTGNLYAQAIGVFCGGSSDGTNAISNCWASGECSSGAGITINLFLTDGGEVSVTNCNHFDERITQGDKIGLIVGNGPIISCLGSQWTSDDNQVILKPSADLLSTNIQNPLFERVTVCSNDPTTVNLAHGQFEGTYSPFADTNDMLLDAHNAANEAFHVAYSYDRSSLGDDFVNWYNDATLTSPATVIPFDADGNVALYAGRWLELANASDNSGIIESVVNSGANLNRTVVLKDRTLYRDDDWNTLCLPFSMNEAQIAASPMAGVTIMELDGTTSNLTGGTLTLNFKEAFSIEAGRPYIVKWQHPVVVINSPSDWESFASAVNNGTESYAGKLVNLGADIDVSAMVGTEEHPFRGIFDGNGHTLNVSIDQAGADYAAPFRYISGATIRNLKVTGSVNGGDYSSGIAGKSIGGTNSIRNCWMDATVTSPYHVGGILGHGTTSSVTISNSYLTGSLSANDIGVLCGGCSDDGTFVLETCWAIGSYTKPFNSGSLNLIFTDSGATVSILDCRHNSSEIAQGDQLTLIGSPSEVNYRIVNFLGNQWTVANDELMLKPSAAYDNQDITNPVFEGVTFDNSDAAQARQTVSFTGGSFRGIYNPVVIAGENKSILFLGAQNTLYYPDASMNINACRAYFDLTDPSAPVKSFVMNFGDEETETGISLTPNPSPVREGSAGAWYDLSGRKISLSPTPSPVSEGRKLPRGIYIHNGKKVVIK